MVSLKQETLELHTFNTLVVSGSTSKTFLTVLPWLLSGMILLRLVDFRSLSDNSFCEGANATRDTALGLEVAIQ